MRDYWSDDRWRFDELLPYLLASIIELLELTVFNEINNGSNMVLWKDAASGQFSIRSTYNLVSPMDNSKIDGCWDG